MPERVTTSAALSCHAVPSMADGRLATERHLRDPHSRQLTRAAGFARYRSLVLHVATSPLLPKSMGTHPLLLRVLPLDNVALPMGSCESQDSDRALSSANRIAVSRWSA